MKEQQFDFTDIEPYRDVHVRDVLKNLMTDEPFLEVMEYVYPDKSLVEIEETLDSIQSIYDFQDKVAYHAMKRIIDLTVEDIVIEGLENLDKRKKYLFISNHRDIILDSAFFNVLLHEKGFDTTETAIGSNLLVHPTVNALTKLNKNFTVSRDVTGRELYVSSLKLSHYIRQSICSGRSSIWISQREGRAKDGDDKTQQGLLKMLRLSADGNLQTDFEGLNVRTLSISYEYDPCDEFKIKEILSRASEEEYVKSPGEDKRSIIRGITGNKGRVHFAIGGEEIDIDSDSLTEMNNNDQLQYLSQEIDRAIYKKYKLWPNNYIAYDMLHSPKKEYKNYYSVKDLGDFDAYIREVLDNLDNVPGAKEILLKKYAFPLINLRENALGLTEIKFKVN